MDKTDWQGSQGTSWADNWRRTDRSFGILTDRILSKLRGFALRQVLDIGCGAGELALAIARSHHAAEVRGVDVSPQLVDAARVRGERLANVSFVCDDAAIWRPEDRFAPDLLVSRHGVMFFSDPIAAFANFSALAAPRAKLVFSCFRALSLNPFMTEIARLLPEPLQTDPRAPGPFAFADASYIEQILSAAGWSNVALAPIDFPMIVGAGEDPVDEARAYFTSIGPAAKALDQLDVAGRAAFLDKLDAVILRNCREGIVSLPAAAWLVTAQNK